MSALPFLSPEQFCIQNGGTFNVIHQESEIRTESKLSYTEGFIGYRVNFPPIGLGFLKNVRLWNDNFGLIKNDTYLMDTPAIVAGTHLYKIFCPHGIAMKDEGNALIPGAISKANPTRMPGRYVLLGSCLGNHAHMVEILTRCLQIQGSLDWERCKFIIAADTVKYIELLNRYFPTKKPDYLVPEKDVLYEFEELHLPTGMQSWPALHPSGGELIQEKNRSNIDDGAPIAGYRLYIDRQSATSRRVANPEVLNQVLSAHGIQAVRLEDKTLDEQIRLFKNASLIVSQHGAGLANTIFSRPGTQIIELVSGAHLMNFTHSAFWFSFLASALGHRHRLLVCDSVPDANRGPKNMDIRVNPRELDMVLRAHPPKTLHHRN